MSDTQRDREERQRVIEILQKEKRTALHDNKWAFDYAIASIKTDLKYDLLYEETSGQADKQADKITTKKDLAVDAISRQAVLNTLDNMDSALDEDRTVETYKELLKECYKVLPSVTPQLSSGLEKNSKKLEKDFGESDCVSREQAKTAIRDRFKDLPSRVEINTILNELPSVTPQEPRKGHWIEHPRTKELRFHHIYECSACKTQIMGNRYNVGNYKYCPHCGIEFEVEG